MSKPISFDLKEGEYPDESIFLIDEGIADEKRDFVDKGIAVINEIQQKSRHHGEVDLKSYMDDLNDGEVKRLQLYNWLATSLVLHDDADVAAIAPFVFSNCIKVFFAKNDLTDDDQDCHGMTDESFA